MSHHMSTIVEVSVTDDHVALLLQRLNDFQRAPPGLLAAWRTTVENGETSTSSLFRIGGGFSAWFAYFLTKNAVDGQAHFSGKAKCGRFIEQLESRTPMYRKQLAARVKDAITPTIRVTIDDLYDKKIEKSQIVESTRPNKKRRTAIIPDCPVSNTINAALSPSSIVKPSHTREQISIQPPNDFVNCFAEDEHVLVKASLEAANKLFPRALSSAIKRIPQSNNDSIMLAAIAMTFPNAPVAARLGCQMTLEIVPSKVLYFAQELFDVRLEIESGLRYVCLAASGLKILPNPKITLQGCPRDIIPHTFGVDPAHAITNNPVYQEEAKQCRDRTDSVSMVISHRADESAEIYVLLGLWEGTMIKQKLYP